VSKGIRALNDKKSGGNSTKNRMFLMSDISSLYGFLRDFNLLEMMRDTDIPFWGEETFQGKVMSRKYKILGYVGQSSIPLETEITVKHASRYTREDIEAKLGEHIQEFSDRWGGFHHIEVIDETKPT
jgi:hypothetical protein